MRISPINYSYNAQTMCGRKQNRSRKTETKTEKEIRILLEPFSTAKDAKVPPVTLMRGVNPNNNDVFDSFSKIDDVTRSINFVRSQSAWNDCLLEEIEEFNVARREYELNKTEQNFDHMEEEMGDIFYTAASIAKDSGINPKKAFQATNRKFYNRINLMERICASPDTTTPNNLKNCKDYERRALWNAAKRKLYDAQARHYANAQKQETNTQN